MIPSKGRPDVFPTQPDRVKCVIAQKATAAGRMMPIACGAADITRYIRGDFLPGQRILVPLTEGEAGLAIAQGSQL
jgi:hypothetical protein